MDVFRGQTIEDALTLFKHNNIRVPANMTHIFQPLDLTVNGTFKTFMRTEFSAWYSRQILRALKEGCEMMDAKVGVKLTIMKLLHVKWLSEFYNYISFSDG